MTRPPRGFVLSLALLALAGWVDGLGFVQWRGLYVSFMSGNTTALGAAAVAGDRSGSLDAGRAILVFVLGVIAGDLIAAASRRWSRFLVLLAETVLLWLAVAAAASASSEAAIVSITGVAMGIQTAVLQQAGGIPVSLTYVTGTLVQIGRSTVKALLRTGSWRDVLTYAMLWAALLGGAVGGSVVATDRTRDALLVAAGLATLLCASAGLAAFNTEPRDAEAPVRLRNKTQK